MNFSPTQLLRRERISDGVYLELIGELFKMLPPIVILAISQCVVGFAIVARTGDVFVLALTIIGLAITTERILMFLRYYRAIASEPLSVDNARIWERRFTTRSIATAVAISAMGARCFMLADPTVHMLITAVLFGFSAGTVTRVAYRPRLALLNLLIVSIPTAIACLLHGGAMYLCLSLTSIIFLLGAFETVQHLYATIVSQFTMKRSFAGLARRNSLTGLSNRLELNEKLETVMADAARMGHSLAVHSLDLNHFKAANDIHGHPTGDAILKEVARRLTRLTRASDLLVRLGGDEFILVQTALATREQAIALASRIVQDIGACYAIGGRDIEIGTSVGIAIQSDEQLTPEELLARADQALYQAKRTGSGIAVHALAPHLVPSIPDADDAQPRTPNLPKSAHLH